jgi:hypothetical protein
MRATAEERFWAKVDIRGDGECWEWRGARDRKGYGRVWLPQRMVLAHRAAWELARAAIPEGMHILHHCDHPPCCNPAHLFLGSNADNVADKVRKQRQARGERSGTHTHPERVPRGDRHFSRMCPERLARGERGGSAKLTQEDVEMIRYAYSTGRFTQRDIATCYAINQAHVSLIVRGKCWKHV